MRVGTRASPLALAQARTVADLLGDVAELVSIVTSGDRAPGAACGDTPFGAQDKERWVKEIELALLEGEIELAVHSAKDVPTTLPEGLELVGTPPRADPFDALVGAPSLDALKPGASVGTASPRRAAQLRALRPDLDVRVIHGNVGTRLGRLEAGELDALVLAAAGLIRLGRSEQIGCVLGEIVPAAGQGTLVLQARAGDERAAAAARAITDAGAWRMLSAERALVAALDASCNTPLGAHAAIGGDGIVLRTFVGLPDGSQWLRDETPPAPTPQAAAELAASRLLACGAAELLRLAEQAAA